MHWFRKIIIRPTLAAITFLLVGQGTSAFGQNARDTLSGPKKPDTHIHSPRTALILAVTLPGSGQAYNRKYWKIPIVYAGYAGGAWLFADNQGKYKSAKQNYLYAEDDDESTINESGKSSRELLTDIDYYRRMRDISVLALLAWHGLTIIDANVDAHFFNWDISEDLSLFLEPRPIWSGFGNPGLGMSVVFNLK